MNRNHLETESIENISRRRFLGNTASVAAMAVAGMDTSALAVQMEGKKRLKSG